jgi:TonB family protein
MAGRALFAALTVLLCAAAETDTPSIEHTSPRLITRPDNFDECRKEGVRELGEYRDVSPTLHLDKDGTLSKFDLAEGTPDWARSLTECVLARLRFSPGTQDRKPIESTANLSIRFRERAPEVAPGVVVDGIGAFITAPWQMRKPRHRNCRVPPKLLTLGQTQQFIVKLVIQPDGTLSDIQLPVGSGPEHEQLAHCLLKDARFAPGTIDGRPVRAEATLPIRLFSDNDTGAVVVPKPAATPEELEAAYQACIPRDLPSMGSAFYRFEVSTRGSVGSPELVKSSGDPRLDEAGLCIVKLLKFTPMTQGGRAMPARITWELPMRPPR